MGKGFDPDKARKDSEAAIAAAEAKRAKYQEKVKPADDKVEAAKKAQTEAAASKQKAVDTAVEQRAFLQQKIDEETARIERERRYLNAFSSLDESVPEGTPVQETEPVV